MNGFRFELRRPFFLGPAQMFFLQLVILFLVGCRQELTAPTAFTRQTTNDLPAVATLQPSKTPNVSIPQKLQKSEKYTIHREWSIQAISMQINERLQLQLGDGYEWSFQFSNERIMRLLDPEESGVYLLEALKPGQTELEAVGKPKCRRVKPPCGKPSLLFALQIFVR
jgi:hypothetical protein